MGREIRMVPPNWEHPRYTKDDARFSDWVGNYKGLYRPTFDEDFAEWQADFDRVRAGHLTEHELKWHPRGLADWLADNRAPRPDDYTHYKMADATWVQVYETVSEGTPVSPPFATKADLVDYLTTHGDFWDQKCGEGPWQRQATERFVEEGFAPSMTVTRTAAGIAIETPGHPAATQQAEQERAGGEEG